MGRISTLQLTPGEVAEVSDVNPILTEWNAAEVGAVNLRDQGLGTESLEAGICRSNGSDAHDFLGNADEEIGLTHTSATLLEVDGNEVVARNLSLDQTEGQQMQVFASCRFYTSHGGLTNTPVINFRLAYCTDYTGPGTGTWQAIGKTLRRFSVESPGVENRGSVTIAHHFQTDGADLTFGLFAWLTGYTTSQTFNIYGPVIFTRRVDL